MPGDVDHIADARHDPEITVSAFAAGVRGLVEPGEISQIRRNESLVVAPQCRQAARTQRELDHDVPDLSFPYLSSGRIHDRYRVARHGLGRGAVLHRLLRKPDWICADRPAGFGLPPMIDDWHAETLLGPLDRVGIG